MECEMCGRKGRLNKVKIEGTVLNVCKYCSNLGEKVAVRKKTYVKPKVFGKKDEELEEIELNPGFEKEIEKGMQKRKFVENTKDFAKLLQIRESYLKRIMHGETKPDKDTARKLEYALRIKIIKRKDKPKKDRKKTDKKETKTEYLPKNKTEPLTIGDIAFIKKK